MPESTITGQREAQLMLAVDQMLNARRDNTPIDSLAADIAPTSLDEAYLVQDRMAEAWGEIGGWKIGAPNAEATPMYAPMPAAWITGSGNTLEGSRWRYRGLEAEIAFLVGQDLPPRERPYTREETLTALASCHPVIEVLESAFHDPISVERLQMIGDMQGHGGFVYGPAVANWQTIDWNVEQVTLSVDGVVRVERTGSNTSGDLLKLLPWLANDGAARTGGLRKGQWITTGSWTGNTLASAGSVVNVHFSTAGDVSLRFA